MEKEESITRPDGITLLAALFWILAILALVGGIFMIGAKDAIIDVVQEQPDITEDIIDLVDSIMLGVGVIAILIGILYAITGWGLWNLKSWARIVAIILGILSLFNFPIGTIIGIVVLWYLFKTDIKTAFQ